MRFYSVHPLLLPPPLTLVLSSPQTHRGDGLLEVGGVERGEGGRGRKKEEEEEEGRRGRRRKKKEEEGRRGRGRKRKEKEEGRRRKTKEDEVEV